MGTAATYLPNPALPLGRPEPDFMLIPASQLAPGTLVSHVEAGEVRFGISYKTAKGVLGFAVLSVDGANVPPDMHLLDPADKILAHRCEWRISKALPDSKSSLEEWATAPVPGYIVAGSMGNYLIMSRDIAGKTKFFFLDLGDFTLYSENDRPGLNEATEYLIKLWRLVIKREPGAGDPKSPSYAFP